MFKNVGKKIQYIAIILAILFCAAFLGFGAACLAAALGEGVDETLKTAGMQGAGICLVLALLSPLFSFVLYGFGSLVIAAQKQAEDSREIKEMLRHALSDGCLSDEIARKTGQVQAKSMQQLTAQLQAQNAQAAAQAYHAPVQRLVEEPTAPQQEQQEQNEEAEEAPAQGVETPAAQPAAPATPKAPKVQKAPTPIRNAKPVASATPLRPIDPDEETF